MRTVLYYNYSCSAAVPSLKKKSAAVPEYLYSAVHDIQRKTLCARVQPSALSGSTLWLEPWPCLVRSENQKVFKIPRHIESCGTCMKY